MIKIRRRVKEKEETRTRKNPENDNPSTLKLGTRLVSPSSLHLSDLPLLDVVNVASDLTLACHPREENAEVSSETTTLRGSTVMVRFDFGLTLLEDVRRGLDEGDVISNRLLNIGEGKECDVVGVDMLMGRTEKESGSASDHDAWMSVRE